MVTEVHLETITVFHSSEVKNSEAALGREELPKLKPSSQPSYI